jgi:hypothetical protein
MAGGLRGERRNRGHAQVSHGSQRIFATEAPFRARATHLGFSACLTGGDSERFESVVTLGHGFLRVQVKSATRYLDTRYRVKSTGASGKVYTAAEIDFFVAYIVPEDIWYIIPIAAIGRRKAPASIPTPATPKATSKIPRSLVSPGLPAQSPRLERHPSQLPMQKSESALCCLPRPAMRLCRTEIMWDGHSCPSLLGFLLTAIHFVIPNPFFG